MATGSGSGRRHRHQSPRPPPLSVHSPLRSASRPCRRAPPVGQSQCQWRGRNARPDAPPSQSSHTSSATLSFPSGNPSTRPVLSSSSEFSSHLPVGSAPSPAGRRAPGSFDLPGSPLSRSASVAVASHSQLPPARQRQQLQLRPPILLLLLPHQPHHHRHRSNQHNAERPGAVSLPLLLPPGECAAAVAVQTSTPIAAAAAF